MYQEGSPPQVLAMAATQRPQCVIRAAPGPSWPLRSGLEDCFCVSSQRRGWYLLGLASGIPGEPDSRGWALESFLAVDSRNQGMGTLSAWSPVGNVDRVPALWLSVFTSEDSGEETT